MTTHGTLEEFPRYCDIVATVRNSDGETATVDMGTRSGTRAEVLQLIRTVSFKNAFREVALSIAADRGLIIHSHGMRVSWDAREAS